MRYLMLLHGNPPPTPPPPDLMEAIMKLGEEATRAGVLLDTQGLAPSAAGGVRVELAGGQLSVTDGPFTEAKEIISYAVYEVRSKEEAVEWASRFIALHRDLWPGWEGDCEIRRVFGPEDFGEPAPEPGDPAGPGGRPAHGTPSCRRPRSGPGAPGDPARGTHAAVEAVWRIESARLVAGLARFVGDVGLAEELAQDALVAALEQWPAEGVPANPGGWLMSTAKHRAIDQLRRRQNYQRKLAEVGRMLEQRPPDEPDLDDHVGDDLLRLVFIACHPVLPTEGRVALTLRLLGGLSTAEIARAFLVPEPTVGQRISRAKRTLREQDVPFELPPPAELPAAAGLASSRSST